MLMIEGLKRAGRDLDEESYIGGLESMKNFDTGGLTYPISYSPTSHKGEIHVRYLRLIQRVENLFLLLNEKIGTITDYNY